MRPKLISIKPSGNMQIASSRLRAYLPCQELKKKIPIEIFKKTNLENYSAVIFQKTYTPNDLKLAKSLKSKGIKIALDQCDNHNIYSKANLAESERAKRMLEMADIADAIFTSTEKIADLFPQKPIFVVPDFIELYEPKIWKKIWYKSKHFKWLRSPRTKLIWFGNAGSEEQKFGLCNLRDKISWLIELNQKTPIQLTVISNSKELFEKYLSETTDFPITYIQWNKHSYAHLISMHDLCIIPININPFTICKSNNRLALTLSTGIPVIADAIPSYNEFAEFCILDDWKKSIDLIKNDLSYLKYLSTEGSRYVRSKYSHEEVAKLWIDAIKKLLGPT